MWCLALSVLSALSGSDIAVEDKVSLVGSTSTTQQQCMAYEGGVCAAGGHKLLVPDAAEPGLIAHYDFDDSRALDSSGHGNHARVVPLSGPGHGHTGNGAWFDGVRVMEVGHIPAMNSADLTVCFWMYLLEDSTNSYRTLLRKAASVGDMTPALMLLPNDRRLHIRLTTTHSGVIGFDSTAVIPLKRWTHVAYVLKGGAALSLYINGVKDCPVLGNSRRSMGCPPGGGTYAWDEGDVRHNTGPLYVGGDPYMSGTSMFLDALKVYNSALAERDIVLEANDALGLSGSKFVRLGCSNCTLVELASSCAELDDYHPCMCHELMGGGLLSARAMGWLRGPSSGWSFHADVQNPATCALVDASVTPPEQQPGFCCRD